MNKAETLKNIIAALMNFAIPSMNPDDFCELKRLTNKLLVHYKIKTPCVYDCEQCTNTYVDELYPDPVPDKFLCPECQEKVINIENIRLQTQNTELLEALQSVVKRLEFKNSGEAKHYSQDDTLWIKLGNDTIAKATGKEG